MIIIDITTYLIFITFSFLSIFSSLSGNILPSILHTDDNDPDTLVEINQVTIFVANLDVGHGGIYAQPYGGEFGKVATAWLSWQLKGDKNPASCLPATHRNYQNHRLGCC